MTDQIKKELLVAIIMVRNLIYVQDKFVALL
jgi:hypothetical protein